MSLRFFARIFNRLIPFDEDKEARAGWSVVRLDPQHPFHRAAVQHDYYATVRHQGKPEVTQEQADLELFLDMATLVRGKTTAREYAKAIELAHDACAFWPVARKFGKLRSG